MRQEQGISCSHPHIVSIHAPREGCDRRAGRLCLRLRGFNSRTPGGVRLLFDFCSNTWCKFQFTHPGRGATGCHRQQSSKDYSFNSRTPGGVRPSRSPNQHNAKDVSIHAPREGCDPAPATNQPPRQRFNSRTPGGVRRIRLNTCSRLILFQFTHPGRGATLNHLSASASFEVSIHAPREGCDFKCKLNFLTIDEFQFTHPGRGATYTPACNRDYYRGFNSRTPGGVRRAGIGIATTAVEFQFTHPGRGATVWCKVAYYGADKQA